MLWKKKRPMMPIDSRCVALGSVVDHHRRNLSRSHVKVKYLRGSQAEFLTLTSFFRRCKIDLRAGRSLGIEHLLVAPILKQRHTEFFDRLADWAPAAVRAYQPSPSRATHPGKTPSRRSSPGRPDDVGS